jgi:predicted ABC-type ATPase
MRVFAGPNGSGKSSLKSVIRATQLGVYVNADDLEATLRNTGSLDFGAFEISLTSSVIQGHLSASEQFKRGGDAGAIRIEEDRILIEPRDVNSYVAAAVADLIRYELLKARCSFTFETVMSHPSKVDFMRKARDAGYRVYFYYIATSDPEINKSRVRERVNLGGHDVPADRVESRYYRSLENLCGAIEATDRAYIFDNSQRDQEKVWFAEVTGGNHFEYQGHKAPIWFDDYVTTRKKTP